MAQENCSGFDALLERDDARFADQRDVLAVVDRELDGVALGDRREVDVRCGVARVRAECEQHEKKRF